MATTPPDPSARIDDLATGVWVLAALARAAGTDPLPEEHGAVLGAAGLAERASGGWRLLPVYRAALAGQADVFPSRIARVIRQAADAAEGWEEPAETDDAVLLADGRASGEDFTRLLDTLAARVPGFDAVLRNDDLRFLDVGTGTGAIAGTVLARVPGSRAVGLDISERMVRLARAYLTEQGVADRVALRRQDVAELTDRGAHDLVWLPLAAIAPRATVAALPRLREALRPGGWLVSATALPGEEQGEGGATREAVIRWRLARRGATPWSAWELSHQMSAAGYRDIRRITPHPSGVTIVTGRGPRSP